MFNNEMAKAFAPAEAHYKSIVMHNTWGHLFPDKPQYKGTVRLAYLLYGTQNVEILDEGDTLPQSSPWWHDAIYEFAEEVAKEMKGGEVVEFEIEVNLVECEEELEPWEKREYDEAGLEPKQWTEIHITPGDAKVLVAPYE